MNAEEVLKQMEADQGKYMQESDGKKYLIIDPESRTIISHEERVLLGVTNDKKGERKYFKCPKIVGDNIDLSSSDYQLRINYRNANGDRDSYLVDDVELVGEEIIFSWELWKKVTLYKGEVKFILCVVDPEGDSIDTEWNTTLATGIVLEGLEVENPEPTSDEKDVIAQLINMMRTESAKAVKTVQDEGKLQVEDIKRAGTLEKEGISEAVNRYIEENQLEDGKDGITPHVGENGNWFIGENDTGVKAAGKDGVSGLSMYTTSEEATTDDFPFTPESIDLPENHHIQVGDLLILPSKKVYKVYSVSYGVIDAAYTFTLTGKDGSDGAPGPQGPKGDTGAIGPQGPKGDPGKTPVKGTDYYTEAEKEELKTELVQLVLEALPNGDERSY